jgi:hypothetical protein
MEMQRLTREQLAKMTPSEIMDHHAAGFSDCAVAMAGASVAFRQLAIALPRFVEACGPGRDWQMSCWNEAEK